MIPDLAAVAAQQGRCFTRTQALDLGATERGRKTALGPRGLWVPVRRGVYAERHHWDAADEPERHVMRVWAAHLTSLRDDPFSHTSAAAVHGLECRPHWRELLHLSHPDVRGGRTEGGTKHHPAFVPEQQVETVGGLLVTDLARTAVDIAREHGTEDGVLACDQVLRLGVPRSELSVVLEQMWSWPYVTHARAAVDLADGGAANLAESLTRLLVIELGHGRPQTQVLVEDGHRRAYLDMVLRGHAFEFDGRLKFVGREHGGVALDPERALWEEKQREDWLRSLGFGISRIIWADLFGVRRRHTLRRLDREFRATQVRLGHRVA